MYRLEKPDEVNLSLADWRVSDILYLRGETGESLAAELLPPRAVVDRGRRALPATLRGADGERGRGAGQKWTLRTRGQIGTKKNILFGTYDLL